MFERIFTILMKEFKQIFRDPRMRSMIFIAPILELLIFGYAATTDVKHIPTAVYDLDNTPQSRAVIQAFANSGYFNVRRYVSNDAAMRRLVDNNEVAVVVHFDHGFERDLNGGKTAQIQLIVDGTDSNTAAIALSYAGGIVNQYASSLGVQRVSVSLRGPPKAGKIDLRNRVWFNENLESRNFYIPGVIAMLITVMSILLTAMAIVREKEIGTMEQLMVSPIRPLELILGKMLPFAVLSFIDLAFIAIVGVLWFKIPIRGSLLLLAGSTCVYLMTTLGAGLFISTISDTQQEASMTMFLFLFPMNLLSGFVFPITSMPQSVQYVTYLIPLRYYLEILRGIFLKGVGLPVLWPQIAALLVIGTATIFLSSLRFRKRLG